VIEIFRDGLCNACSSHTLSLIIDIVARLPLGSLSYRHVGHLLLVRDDNDLVAYYCQDGQDDYYAGVPDKDWKIDYDWNHILSPLVHHFWWNYENVIDTASNWPREFEVCSDDECCWGVGTWCWKDCSC